MFDPPWQKQEIPNLESDSILLYISMMFSPSDMKGVYFQAKISLRQLLGGFLAIEVDPKLGFKWPANLGLQQTQAYEWGLWGPYKWPKRKGNWGYFTRLLGIITPLIEAVGCRSCNNHHLKDSEKNVFNSVVPFRHLWDVKLVEVDVKSIWSFQNPTKILVFSVLCEMRRDASFKIWCHVIHVSKKHLHTQRWGPIEL